MKKYILLPIIAILLLNTSCQDKLEKDFVNPGIYSPTDNVPSGMFAAIMSRERNFKNDYAEYWWHLDVGGIAGYAQLTTRSLRAAQSYYADLNDNRVMACTELLSSYFYGHNSDFRELPLMEDLVAGMTDAEKADNQIYITIAKMVRGYRASKAVDLFNSVPYSEGLKGTAGQFFPKFDDPAEIYKSIITDLGTLPDLLTDMANKMSPDGKRIFSQQDIIFKGDINKWQQWAAGIRLRLAVRISGVEEAFARTAISDIMAKGNLPTSDIYVSADAWITKDGAHWKLGLNERDYAAFFSASFMYRLDRDMDHIYTPGSDDPRLPVFCLPNRDTLYMPMSYDFLIGDKIQLYVQADNKAKYGYNDAYFRYNYFSEVDRYLKYNHFCLYSPTTFVRNAAPFRAITAAEVDFLLAEVALKGLAGSGNSAENHLKNGVINSINYWYDQNATSNWDKVTDANRSFLKPTRPDQAILDQFANKVVADFTRAGSQDEKLGVIITQKYVHLNIQDFIEVFAELRRTRYPKLAIIKYGGALALKPVVERFPYPGSETASNTEAVNAVASQNDFITPIFWVPASKRGEEYYEKSFNDIYMYNRYKGVPESFKGF